MKYRSCFACLSMVAALTGCLNTNTAAGHEEPKGSPVAVRRTETKVPAGAKDLKMEVGLSTNTVAVSGNVSITVKLINAGKTDVTIDRNNVSAWISVADSRGASITELPFMDKICAAGKALPLVIPGGGSEVIRVFGAQVTKGSWKGFGNSGTFDGVGFVLQRDSGASCYPLKGVPGEYVLRCHLSAKASGAGGQPAVEIVSDEMPVSVIE